MKNLLDLLTSPKLTSREYFILCTARAIAHNFPRNTSDPNTTAARAVAAAAKWDVIPMSLSPYGFGKLVQSISDCSSYYRRLE